MPVSQIAATVIDNQEVIKDHRVMVCDAPLLAREAKPGHFVNVLASETINNILRKPFSIFHADPESGTVAILYQVKGATTVGMAKKTAGDPVDLVGPLGGVVFTPDTRPGVTHVMVGGGYGVPPLVFFCERLIASDPDVKITFVLGARSAERLLCEAELKNLGVDIRLATEDGSRGVRGRVTDALGDLLSNPVAVYTCGPSAMMRAVGDACIAADAPCQVSLEAPMPCGVGVCMGCVVDKLDGSRVRACTEGPVFDARTVVWK